MTIYMQQVSPVTELITLAVPLLTKNGQFGSFSKVGFVGIVTV